MESATTRFCRTAGLLTLLLVGCGALGCAGPHHARHHETGAAHWHAHERDRDHEWEYRDDDWEDLKGHRRHRHGEGGWDHVHGG